MFKLAEIHADQKELTDGKFSRELITTDPQQWANAEKNGGKQQDNQKYIRNTLEKVLRSNSFITPYFGICNVNEFICTMFHSSILSNFNFKVSFTIQIRIIWNFETATYNWQMLSSKMAM